MIFLPNVKLIIKNTDNSPFGERKKDTGNTGKTYVRIQAWKQFIKLQAKMQNVRPVEHSNNANKCVSL